MNSLGEPGAAPPRERDHLASAHHELCTALTVIRSNVELARIRLGDPSPPEKSVPIRAHLDEIDGAIERLLSVAHAMRRWHDEAE